MMSTTDGEHNQGHNRSRWSHGWIQGVTKLRKKHVVKYPID